MNAQERTVLVEFLDRLLAAQPGHKDPEADGLIAQACARQPDACYLLAQRALQLEQALKITQAEVSSLQALAVQPREGGNFLGEANAWGRTSATSATSTATGTTGSPSPAAAGGFAERPATSAPVQRFGSGILGNVATTAAGVAAGSFLYQGVQSLLGRRGTEAPWGAAAHPTATGHTPLSNQPADTRQHPGRDVATWNDGGGDGDGEDFG